MANKIRITCLILFIIAASVRLSQWSRYRDAGLFVCEMVEQKFYDSNQVGKSWGEECREQVRSIHFWTTEKSALSRIQQHLDTLETSHLQIFTPAEDLALWTGTNLDTGLRVRMFESGAVVSEVYPGSAAAVAEVKKGDLLVSINGHTAFSMTQVQTTKGEYEFRRGESARRVALIPQVLTLDERVHLAARDKKTALLTIPSFRAAFFEAEAWKQLVARLSGYSRVIVDVRQNNGGNFVAMLRALSPFFCEPQRIGELSSTRVTGRIDHFDDELGDDYQIHVMEKYGQVGLQTFPNYGCLRAEVTVLADSGTASVAEIFVSALKQRPQTRFLGAATAGDVVLAVWYAIPLLRPGYTLSIPEAIYKTPNGEVLEGQGLWPDRPLYYLEEDALRGEDTWILKAQKFN